MTLKEAIIHAKTVAKTCDDDKCKLEHVQLAGWLEELRHRRKEDLNEPLTWDELRQMEEKPVWWTHGEVGEWLTIYRVPTLGNGNDNVIYATTCSGVECWIWKKDLEKYKYYKREIE